MKLFMLTQNVNNDYDTYDSAVVAAHDEEEAKQVKVGDYGEFGTWASPINVRAELIGTAKKGTKVGVVLASFNAG